MLDKLEADWMGAGVISSKRMAMESHLSDVVREQWTAQKLAKVAGVDPNTATEFLRRRAENFQRTNDRLILQISADAGATFHRAAQRQLTRLQTLEDKEKWTAADYKLEKHAIACLGPLIKWCAMSAGDLPGEKSENAKAEKPQLSDGL